MATYFSILAWRIPWTEEPGGLRSMGLQSQMRLSISKTQAIQEGICRISFRFSRAPVTNVGGAGSERS